MANATDKVTNATLVDACNAVVNEAEQLLKMAADGEGSKVGALRTKLEAALHMAKARLQTLEEVAVGKTKVVVKATDDYVHEHPWKAIGMAAGLGVVIGLLMNRR